MSGAGCGRSKRPRRLLCGAYLAVWCAAVAALAPALAPGLAVALSLYCLALVVTACTAHVEGARAAWGGAVFFVSDLLIGLAAAGVGFPGRSLLVMPTYTVALALLVTALSTGGHPPGAPASVPLPTGRGQSSQIGVRWPEEPPARRGRPSGIEGPACRDRRPGEHDLDHMRSTK